MCCSPWCCKESDTTELLNNNVYLLVHFTECEIYLGGKNNCHRMKEKQSRLQPDIRVIGVQVDGGKGPIETHSPSASSLLLGPHTS